MIGGGGPNSGTSKKGSGKRAKKAAAPAAARPKKAKGGNGGKPTQAQVNARADRLAASRREHLFRARDLLNQVGLFTSLNGSVGIVVEGQEYHAPKGSLSPTVVARWMDELVAKHFQEHLLTAVRTSLDARGLQLRLGTCSQGAALHREGEVIALIRPSHATVRHVGRVDGDFLISGRHWGHLRKAILRHDARRAAVEARARPTAAGSGPPKRPPREEPAPTAAPARVRAFVYTSLPAGLTPSARSDAMAASAELRDRRSLIFEHRVELIFSRGRLQFLPLDVRENGTVRVPFEWQRDGDLLVGALRLTTTSDPLALIVLGDHDASLVGPAWAAALAGYADLTCVEVRDAAPREAAGSTAGSSDGGRRITTRVSTPHGPGLRPLGQTREWMASYVAGHRRRLRRGQVASEDARRAAARVGIRLRPHETWVKPHVRGIPHDAVLRFAWSLPNGL